MGVPEVGCPPLALAPGTRVAAPSGASRRAARLLPSFRAVLLGLYLVAGAAVVWLLLQGSSFYLTPLGERAHHDGYWTWKSGGSAGRALGVAGSSMLLLLLLYSARKRIELLRGLGPLGRWLDVHIFLGVFGPLLIVLHSAFKVQGLVALSFWSMVAVALSGVAGRYLYLQIPRTRAGEALGLAELEAADRRLGQRLRAEFRLDEAQLAQLERLAVPEAAPGLAGTLVELSLGRARRRRRLRAFARGCRALPRPLLRELERVVLAQALARQRLALWDRIHELFHYWNVLHKPFALVMYLFMAIHVAVAVLTGYGWAGGS
jgi:hypothetical protein